MITVLVTLGMGGKEKQKLREETSGWYGVDRKSGEGKSAQREWLGGGKAGEVRQPWFEVAEQREVERYSHLMDGIPRSWKATEVTTPRPP